MFCHSPLFATLSQSIFSCRSPISVHDSSPHESAGWFGIYARMRNTAQRHLDRASVRTYAFHPGRTPLLFFLTDSQGRLGSYLFFDLFLRSCGRGGWFCIQVLFLPSKRACAVQQKDKLIALNPSASCEEAPCSNKSSSPLRRELLLSRPLCWVCYTALEVSLQDQS